jgi:hypothetical protein
LVTVGSFSRSSIKVFVVGDGVEHQDDAAASSRLPVTRASQRRVTVDVNVLMGNDADPPFQIRS